jgi:hypothetical protein
MHEATLIVSSPRQIVPCGDVHTPVQSPAKPVGAGSMSIDTSPTRATLHVPPVSLVASVVIPPVSASTSVVVVAVVDTEIDTDPESSSSFTVAEPSSEPELGPLGEVPLASALPLASSSRSNNGLAPVHAPGESTSHKRRRDTASV